MAKAIKTCRVCGKRYEACSTPNFTNKFRWKDVACCEACGEEYLRRILESRKNAVNEENKQVVEPTEEHIEEYFEDGLEEVDDEDDEDEEEDELFEDDEEELSFESSDVDE